MVAYYKLVVSLNPSPAFDEQKFIRTYENYINRCTFVDCGQTGSGVIKQLMGCRMSKNPIYRYKSNAINLGMIIAQSKGFDYFFFQINLAKLEKIAIPRNNFLVIT